MKFNKTSFLIKDIVEDSRSHRKEMVLCSPAVLVLDQGTFKS